MFFFFWWRKAFSKRPGAVRSSRGKLKELSPQDAAIMIQMTFRAYLIRRSQALRALRDLAVAKTKLKEVRALFNNFSYRCQVARDAEERQKFSEKIIVLLLTVDAIEVSLLSFKKPLYFLFLFGDFWSAIMAFGMAIFNVVNLHSFWFLQYNLKAIFYMRRFYFCLINVCSWRFNFFY